MELFKTFGKPDADEGEWFPWEPKADPKADPAALCFRVRRITPTQGREFARKHRLPNRKITLKRGGMEYETYTDEKFRELEAQIACNVEMAAWALTDTKNAEVGVGDEEMAKAYSDALGAEVKVGSLALDGRLTPALRLLVLSELPPLVGWVLEKSGSLGLQEAETEEGKG